MGKNKIIVKKVTIAEETSDLFNWLLKYDPKYQGCPELLAKDLINVGAQTLYKEGLKNAEPLDEDVSKYLAEYSKAAIKKALN
jgi:hypothetical protein